MCACTRTPRAADVDVVFIVLDAAGARYFGCYGNLLPTTPRIDALAREATLFTRAYAQASWTLASTSSFMTGRYPPPSSVKALRTADTLAAVLQRHGVFTAGFSENPYVTRTFGLAEGFEEMQEYLPHAVYEEAPNHFVRPDSQRTIDDAMRVLAEHRDEPVFLYVHLLLPHAPYDPPPPFAGRFDPDYAGSVHGDVDTLQKIDSGQRAIDARDLAHLRLQYQENLAWADHQTGRLLDAVAARGRSDRTLLIISADHGEAFRDHGSMLHSTTVFEDMIHVPLVVRFPSAVGPVPRRWAGVVELRAILPTVCDALQLERCPTGLPPSLLQQMRGGDETTGMARSWAYAPYAAALLSHHKLIVDTRTWAPVALFDVAADPGETRDLAALHPEVVANATALLRDPTLPTYDARDTRIDPATAERLRALGYQH